MTHIDASITTRLGEYAAAFRDATLPSEVTHQAKRCVLDWFAAALPGSVAEPTPALIAALADEIGHGRARILPGTIRASARTAALVNGVAAHAVEFDDIYRDGGYHPGAPVIAAALAVAEREGLDGRAFLAAVVAGYEVSNRIARAAARSHYRYWHTTGTVGALGAAVAAGVALGLDGAAIGHAMANATTLAAGLQQAFRSDAHAKPLHAGNAAQAGVLAAAGAAHGMRGAGQMLEGEHGFGAAMAPEADWSSIFEDLDGTYTMASMTQKNHGCCGHTFAALDAIIELRAAHGFEPSAVERIRVSTYQVALDVTGNHAPSTPYEAKFSLPYCAARALVDGRVRLDAFAVERLADAGVRALMSKVELHADPDASAAFPARRAATVEIDLAGGETLRRVRPTRKGDPDDPLSDAELDAKFDELAAPVLGDDGTAALRAAVWSLDERGAVSDLPLAPGDAALKAAS